MASAVADFLSLTQTTPQSIGRTDLTCKACDTVLCRKQSLLHILYIFLSVRFEASPLMIRMAQCKKSKLKKCSLDLNMKTIIFFLCTVFFSIVKLFIIIATPHTV
jgi:hypothetical protein